MQIPIRTVLPTIDLVQALQNRLMRTLFPRMVTLALAVTVQLQMKWLLAEATHSSALQGTMLGLMVIALQFRFRLEEFPLDPEQQLAVPLARISSQEVGVPAALLALASGEMGVLVLQAPMIRPAGLIAAAILIITSPLSLLLI